MSYHYHRSRAEAKRFTEQLDAERRLEAHRIAAGLERSRAWLEQYRAQPRPTRFDWRPRLPVIKPIVTPIPPGETNGKEIIEGEYTIVADADASSEDGGIGGQAEGRGDAAPESIGAAAQQVVDDFEATEGPHRPF